MTCSSSAQVFHNTNFRFILTLTHFCFILTLTNFSLILTLTHFPLLEILNWFVWKKHLQGIDNGAITPRWTKSTPSSKTTMVWQNKSYDTKQKQKHLFTLLHFFTSGLSPLRQLSPLVRTTNVHFWIFQASECQERDPDSKTKDSPERKIFTTKRKKSAHEKKISTHERKISTHERKMISAPERKISAPERKVCASITLPSPQERRPLQQYQLRYQEQQCQDIDERLESDYDQLEQQRVDFCTYPRGEDHINDIDFREENYHEYVNNLPEEQFELEETGSRYTIEKLPGQLQVTQFILTSFEITCMPSLNITC